MALSKHAQWVDDLTGAGTRLPRVNAATNAFEVWDAAGTTLLETTAPAPVPPSVVHSWDMLGAVSINDVGLNFVLPVNGVVEYLALICADLQGGGILELELVNATTGFTPNPTVTVSNSGSAVTLGPLTLPVVSRSDVIYPRVTANSTAPIKNDVSFSVAVRLTA